MKTPMSRSAAGATGRKMVDVISATPRPADVAATRATKVYNLIKEDILSGRLPPGAKLQFDAMRTAYKSGLSPLREALTRLAPEGLVVLQDQRGFSVSPVSPEDLLELTELRIILEGQAVRLSLEKGDDEWEAGLLAAYHRLKKAGEKQGANPAADLLEWEDRHREFHHAFSAACGSRHLLAVRDRLFDLSDRYRRLIAQDRAMTRAEHRSMSASDHSAMVKLALARDHSVIGLTRRHIEQTYEFVLSRLNEARLETV